MKKLPKTVMVKKPPGSTLSSSKPPPPPPPSKKIKTRYVLFTLVGIAAVIAMVAVPVVLVRKKVGVPVTYVDPDKIPTKIPFDLSKISMEDRNRINCFLESESRYENLTRYQCETVRSCIFKPTEYDRVPDCYFRRELLGYELVNFNSQNNIESYHLRRSKIGNATYLEPIEYLILTVEYLSNNMIHLKIEDENDPNRYQIPYELNKPELIDNKLNSKVKFTHSVDSNKLFQFKITRASDNEIIFDTTMGAFVYHNQFIQISTRLSSPYIYGFGENNHPKLLHDLNFRSWGMWARDNAPGWGDNRNLYGFQPVYYSINEKNQKSHLVLLYNSNAMEYLFTPTPSLTLRTIGGILDFYFVVDDVPETIFQTYHNLIGKPIFPPYWSLGFQICRWGYQKLDDVKAVVNRTNAISLPQDVQYIDIEYMIGYRILTINQLNFSGLSTYQQELENKGIKLVLIEDPGLVIERNNSYYMNGISRKDGGIYTKWPQHFAPYDKDALNKDDMISWCWPNGKLSFPDYLYEDTHLWWEESLRDFMAPSSIQAGNGSNMAGVWIDMNEPSSFETNENKPWNWLWPDNDQDRYPHFTLKCPVNKYDDPPYRTKNAFAFDSADLANKKARLSQKTLCMIATQRHKGKEYLHYDVHNLYGHSQSIATFSAMKNIKGTRPFVLTRSNFVGTGHYAAHWLGDNESKWEHMRMSIVGLIEYNIFGFAMIGADICGFFDDVRDAEMCTRWLQLGAFYTLSRNHNANGNRDKDPASFNDPILEESTRSVYHIRYTILPYIYTILYNTHRYGGTAIKALHFEFPQDKNTYSIDEQFLLGKALLVSPVLYPNKTEVNAYLPSARWYDYRTGAEVLTKGQRTFSAPLDYIPLHLRGGTAIPIQFPDGCLNTVCRLYDLKSRSKPLGVIVSLDENQSASGDFYWDEGETLIDFNNADDNQYFYARYKFENQVLELNVEHSYDGVTGAKLNDIWIYGLSVSNPSIEIGGSILEASKFEYNQGLKVLKLKNLELPIANGFKVEIKTQRLIHIKKAL